MNTTEGHGVRITGYVERVFTPPSRKCSFVTVSFPSEKPGKRTKVDLVAFQDMVEPASALGQGELVTVTAGLSNKLLTNKAKQDVQVDGRNVWILQMVIRTITTAKSDTKAAPKDEAPPPAQKSWGETHGVEDDWK